MRRFILVLLPSLFLTLWLWFPWSLFGQKDLSSVEMNWVILPVLALIGTGLMTGKYLQASTKQAFLINMLPGFTASFQMMYGWYLMGHGYGFDGFLVSLIANLGVLIILFFSLVSGVLGLMLHKALKQLLSI